MARFVTLTLNPALDISTQVDHVVDAHKMRCAPAQVYPGGGGINVARVLRRLDAEVMAIATAGGATGERLGTLLAAEQVRTQWVPVAGETRENFTVAESTTGREFRFVLPGPTLRQAEWQACLDRVARLPVRPDYLVASGSLPPGVPDDFYARLARWARHSGSRLVLDTSGAPLAAALAEGVWGIKPSLRELRHLTGARLETLPEQVAAARALVARGQAEMVALSLGPHGALLSSPRQTLSAAALKVQPLGTVGAGDSFLAGWIAEWATHEDPVRALRMAMAAASAALLAPGTALSDPQQIARLLPQVEVRECA